MPIQGLRLRPQILAKIRLGVKKTAASGKQYPSNTEYFVLESSEAKDSPLYKQQQKYLDKIKSVYGEEPSELDIIFPSEDLNIVLPTYYKWFRGSGAGKDGSFKAGTLQCYGDGPDHEGNPGTATHLAARDRVTGIVPTRPCLGKDCPDFLDSRGTQQCVQTMQVFCILPRVHPTGIFQITTSSWNSIIAFHSVLQMDKNMRAIAGVPYKIIRVPRDIAYFDARTKSDKKSTHYIMELHQNEDFTEMYGEECAKLAQSNIMANRIALPTQEEALGLPEGRAFGEMNVDEIQEEKQQLLGSSEQLVDDPDIKALFDQLEGVTGKEYTRKARLIAIRKKESDPDQKKAVIDTLKGTIESEAAKAKSASSPSDVM